YLSHKGLEKVKQKIATIKLSQKSLPSMDRAAQTKENTY
ncbi:uncharacterized protein METZ01_LOCUS195648, partial [marine metagenome]